MLKDEKYATDPAVLVAVTGDMLVDREGCTPLTELAAETGARVREDVEAAVTTPTALAADTGVRLAEAARVIVPVALVAATDARVREDDEVGVTTPTVLATDTAVKATEDAAVAATVPATLVAKTGATATEEDEVAESCPAALVAAVAVNPITRTRVIVPTAVTARTGVSPESGSALMGRDPIGNALIIASLGYLKERGIVHVAWHRKSEGSSTDRLRSKSMYAYCFTSLC
jgi:hypothetical protein